MESTEKADERNSIDDWNNTHADCSIGIIQRIYSFAYNLKATLKQK